MSAGKEDGQTDHSTREEEQGDDFWSIEHILYLLYRGSKRDGGKGLVKEYIEEERKGWEEKEEGLQDPLSLWTDHHGVKEWLRNVVDEG